MGVARARRERVTIQSCRSSLRERGRLYRQTMRRKAETDHLVIHGASRFETWGAPEPRTLNLAGWRRDDGDGGSDYLIPCDVWRADVCGGPDAGAVAKVLAERGALVPGAGGRRGDALPRRRRGAPRGASSAFDTGRWTAAEAWTASARWQPVAAPSSARLSIIFARSFSVKGDGETLGNPPTLGSGGGRATFRNAGCANPRRPRSFFLDFRPERWRPPRANSREIGQ